MIRMHQSSTHSYGSTEIQVQILYSSKNCPHNKGQKPSKHDYDMNNSIVFFSWRNKLETSMKQLLCLFNSTVRRQRATDTYFPCDNHIIKEILSIVIYQAHPQWLYGTPHCEEGTMKRGHQKPISPLILAKLFEAPSPSVSGYNHHPDQGFSETK